MSEIFLPRTLIVIQVIFGRPLRDQREFRSGDIEELVAGDLGLANYAKALDRLVRLGWVNRTVRKQTVTRGGRPSMYVYNRTRTGREGYTALRSQLAKYGINLS